MRYLLVAVTVLAMAIGCARQSGVVQPDSESYLLLTGNIDNTVLFLDGQRVGELEKVAETFDYKDGRAVQLAVEPGMRRVEVQRAGRSVVNRQLYLNDQQTMEVVVP